MVSKEHIQDLRERAAIAAMQGLISAMSNTQILQSIYSKAAQEGLDTSEWVAKTAADYANELINALYAEQEQTTQQTQQVRGTEISEMQVGEVRELNGCKYQCVKAYDRDCDHCALNLQEDDECLRPNEWGNCDADYRKDGTDVIFEQVTQ